MQYEMKGSMVGRGCVCCRAPFTWVEWCICDATGYWSPLYWVLSGLLLVDDCTLFWCNRSGTLLGRAETHAFWPHGRLMECVWCTLGLVFGGWRGGKVSVLPVRPMWLLIKLGGFILCSSRLHRETCFLTLLELLMEGLGGQSCDTQLKGWHLSGHLAHEGVQKIAFRAGSASSLRPAMFFSRTS